METGDKIYSIFNFFLFWFSITIFSYAGWPKKVSHDHELSLNRIKPRH